MGDLSSKAQEEEEVQGKEVQLLTIIMQDGTQSTFIGLPLVDEDDDKAMSEAWFSTIKTLPTSTTLGELLEFTRTEQEPTELTH